MPRKTQEYLHVSLPKKNLADVQEFYERNKSMLERRYRIGSFAAFTTEALLKYLEKLEREDSHFSPIRRPPRTAARSSRS